MSTPIDFQVIKQDGRPLFAVVPYGAFVALLKAQVDKDIYLPHEVVRMTAVEGMSMLKAWRTHKGFSLAEVSEKAEMSQKELAQMEDPDTQPPPEILEKLAKILHLDGEQIRI